MAPKYFLLIAGNNYYPRSRTGDWIDTFETKEEAIIDLAEQIEEYLSNIMKLKGFTLLEM